MLYTLSIHLIYCFCFSFQYHLIFFCLESSWLHTSLLYHLSFLDLPYIYPVSCFSSKIQSVISNLPLPPPFQVQAISKEWAGRADLPPHVVNMLNNFPSNLHPMAQFSAAITALNSESKFSKGYSDGVPKSKYWEVRGCLDTVYLSSLEK